MKLSGVAGRRPLHCVKGLHLRAFRLQSLRGSENKYLSGQQEQVLVMAASGGAHHPLEAGLQGTACWLACLMLQHTLMLSSDTAVASIPALQSSCSEPFLQWHSPRHGLLMDPSLSAIGCSKPHSGRPPSLTCWLPSRGRPWPDSCGHCTSPLLPASPLWGPCPPSACQLQQCTCGQSCPLSLLALVSLVPSWGPASSAACLLHRCTCRETKPARVLGSGDRTTLWVGHAGKPADGCCGGTDAQKEGRWTLDPKPLWGGVRPSHQHPSGP